MYPKTCCIFIKEELSFSDLSFLKSFEEILFLWSHSEYGFEFAKDSGLGTTTHAGEICGAKSVDEAIKLGVTRIGHGVRSCESEETIINLLKEKGVYT